MLNFFLARNNKINKEEVKNNILDILIDVVTYYVVTHTHTDKHTRYIYIYIGVYIRFQNTSVTNGHHSMSVRNKIGKQNGFCMKSL